MGPAGILPDKCLATDFTGVGFHVPEMALQVPVAVGGMLERSPTDLALKAVLLEDMFLLVDFERVF